MLTNPTISIGILSVTGVIEMKIHYILLFLLPVAVVVTACGGESQITASQPSINILASGLQSQDLEIGDGPEIQVGDIASMHYTGWLEDGTKFDSSLDRGRPFELILGAGDVIKGWDEGVAGMKVGGKRKLTIPPELGYGTSGVMGVIPLNAKLIFEVELLAIKGAR